MKNNIERNGFVILLWALLVYPSDLQGSLQPILESDGLTHPFLSKSEQERMQEPLIVHVLQPNVSRLSNLCSVLGMN